MNPLFEKLLSRKQNPTRLHPPQQPQVKDDEWRMLHRIYNIVTYYNLAACYQRRGLFKDSQQYIVKAIEHLKLMIEHQSLLRTPNADYQCLLYERFFAQFVL